MLAASNRLLTVLLGKAAASPWRIKAAACAASIYSRSEQR